MTERDRIRENADFLRQYGMDQATDKAKYLMCCSIAIVDDITDRQLKNTNKKYQCER